MTLAITHNLYACTAMSVNRENYKVIPTIALAVLRVEQVTAVRAIVGWLFYTVISLVTFTVTPCRCCSSECFHLGAKTLLLPRCCAVD